MCGLCQRGIGPKAQSRQRKFKLFISVSVHDATRRRAARSGQAGVRLLAMAHLMQRLMNSDLAQGLSSRKGLLIALVLGALLCLAAAGAVVKLNAAAAAAASAAATCAAAVDDSGTSGSAGGGESQEQASPPINTAVTTGMFALACMFAAYSAVLCTIAARAAQSST